MFTILVVEDDGELQQLFCRVLAKNGYRTLSAGNGREALEVIDQEYVDLVISDVMMPEMDGYELAASLRETGSTLPILMITAKDGFQEIRQGFLSGTDDYMVKPINVNEMVLRVGALLRRAQMMNERKLTVGETILDCDTLTIYTPKGRQELPQKEFQLLYKLLTGMGRIFTRQQLMDEIWGYASETEARTVDVHISRLRERLRENPDVEIATVRGIGYKAVKRRD